MGMAGRLSAQTDHTLCHHCCYASWLPRKTDYHSPLPPQMLGLQTDAVTPSEKNNLESSGSVPSDKKTYCKKSCFGSEITQVHFSGMLCCACMI